jgi:hypothetical protein
VSRRAPETGSTKGGRRRTVDLSPQLIAELAAIVKARPALALAGCGKGQCEQEILVA